MFMTDDTRTSWNMQKSGYELVEKLSFEDKAIKKFVPTLKEIGVHPYRWVRLTVPEGFIYKPHRMPMAPGLKMLLDIDFARKAYTTYDYLAWKLRCYNKANKVSEVSTEAEQAINELFLIMIDSETAKYPISGAKRKLIGAMIKHFNGSALKTRSGDDQRVADED
jgi:hypothetical protein